MKQDDFNSGIPEDVWESAKEEARKAMIAVAKRKEVITYSDLVNKIVSCRLEPRSQELAHMLGEISSNEHGAGRGMLSVLVVHKSGDCMPGPGFFELASLLGSNVEDHMEFWIRELKKVHETWSSAPSAQ
ncbi:MAG: hypothetical protein OXI60_01840 [Acidiferrobacterales bacterium]|nr:hypothetical protein [Acidiferrobacterales bacterium]